MTRHLYLLRHAKSSWDDPSLPDHDRPLAPRGRKAVRRLATQIEQVGIRPALVLCSSATRARETLDGVAVALGKPDVLVEERLYAATEDRLLARLRLVEADVPSVLVVGHNPGLQELAVLLARPCDAADRIAEKLPTGALVSLRLDGDWSTVRGHAAELEGLIVPRELS